MYSLNKILFYILILLMCALLVFKFSGGWKLCYSIMLTLCLTALAVIDQKTKLLPNFLTIPFLILGLVVNLQNLFCPFGSACLGVGAGYLSLSFFAWIFLQITGKVGMGNGDFKLFALLGAWFGWQSLPYILLIACVLGCLMSTTFLLYKKLDRNTHIAFGPYLAIAGWLTLICNQTSFL